MCSYKNNLHLGILNWDGFFFHSCNSLPFEYPKHYCEWALNDFHLKNNRSIVNEHLRSESKHSYKVCWFYPSHYEREREREIETNAFQNMKQKKFSTQEIGCSFTTVVRITKTGWMLLFLFIMLFNLHTTFNKVCTVRNTPQRSWTNVMFRAKLNNLYR